MENAYQVVTSTISMLAAIITTALAFIAAQRYVFKKSYFGEEAENKFDELGFDKLEFEIVEFQGGANKRFPNLVIEKKWGRAVKVTYYIIEDGKKLKKTWQKKKTK